MTKGYEGYDESDISAHIHCLEPLNRAIDLERSKAETLVIHESHSSVQASVDSLTDTLPPDSFDRIALPRPSEQIRDSQLLTGMIEKLRLLHDFETIIVAEPANIYQRSARSILKDLFPELKIRGENAEDDGSDPASLIALICSDKRFQGVFAEQMAKQIPERTFRYALAGSSLALRKEAAVRWVAEPIEKGGITDVYIYQHLDCGITGGLPEHNWDEHSEAVKHAEALDDAHASIRNIRPHQAPRIHENIVGVTSMWDVSSLKEYSRQEAR